MQDCPQALLGRGALGGNSAPGSMASPPAPGGWKRLAGVAVGGGKVPTPLQHWRKALGLCGARGGHEGVGGATPGSGAGFIPFIYTRWRRRSFLLSVGRFWLCRNRIWAGELGRDFGLEGGEALSHVLGLVYGAVSPPGAACGAVSWQPPPPQSWGAPGPPLPGLRGLLGCSGWRSAPRNSPLFSTEPRCLG